jgi:hypothetical protein
MKHLVLIILLFFSFLCKAQQIVAVITDKAEISKYIGKVITIKGVVSNTKISTILGVDVDSDNPDLRGKEAKASGILLQWTVKPEDVDNHIQTRGAGTFYRLKDIDSDYNAQVVEPDNYTVDFNTKDSIFTIDGNLYNIKSLMKTLGEPSRIKRNEFESVMTEYPLNADDKPQSYTVKYINYYFIYDKLGLMFYTDNSYLMLSQKDEDSLKKPVAMLVNFGNRRSFNHDKPMPFMPEKSFTGIFNINGSRVDALSKVIPDQVNYNTKEFLLYNALFSSTSFSGVIDGVYSRTCFPSLFIKLDSPKDQRTSFIILR